MAMPIKEEWELDIREVENGRYLQKVYTHTTSGCEFTEREYLKRTQENRK